jgi:hypothetical protein
MPEGLENQKDETDEMESSESTDTTSTPATPAAKPAAKPAKPATTAKSNTNKTLDDYDPSFKDDTSTNVLQSINTQKTLKGSPVSVGSTASKDTKKTPTKNVTDTGASTLNTMKNKDTPVNTMVQAAETVGKNKSTKTEGMQGRDLNEVQEDSNHMNSMINQMKGSPEMAESLKVPGIDISELNQLMNKLNKVVDSFM